MGSVCPPGPALTKWNYAYHSQEWSVPQSKSRRSISLPIGLLALANHSFVKDAEPVSLANLLVSPPWHFHISDVSSLIGDISVSASDNHLSLDWDEASSLFDQHERTLGETWHANVSLLPACSAGPIDLHLSARPSLETNLTYLVDDGSYDFLNNLDEISELERYRAQIRSHVTGIATLNPGVTSAISIGENCTLALGMSPALHLGVYRAAGQLDFELETGEGLFSGPNLHSVESSIELIESESLGVGLGFDFGLALRFSAFDFGFGAQNLGSAILWRDSVRSDYSLEFLDNQGIAYRRVGPAQTLLIREYLKPVLTCSSSYRMRSWIIAVQLQARDGVHSSSLGAEHRFSFYDLRWGFRVDERSRICPSVGLGVRLFETVDLDLGAATTTLAHGNTGLVLGVGWTFFSE